MNEGALGDEKLIPQHRVFVTSMKFVHLVVAKGFIPKTCLKQCASADISSQQRSPTLASLSPRNSLSPHTSPHQTTNNVSHGVHQHSHQQNLQPPQQYQHQPQHFNTQQAQQQAQQQSPPPAYQQQATQNVQRTPPPNYHLATQSQQAEEVDNSGAPSYEVCYLLHTNIGFVSII